MGCLAINNINLIDVKTGSVSVKSVLSENGVITCIGEDNMQGDETIDLSGMYMMPGFINCHSHLAWDGTKMDIKLQSVYDSEAISAFKYAENMRRCLNVGITAVRDLGVNKSNIYAKEAVDRNIIESPKLYISGQAIMCTGGHTWWCGREVDGPWEIKKAIREQAKAGAKVIKIMASGTRPEFTVDELRAAVEESHDLGLKIAAHATFGAAIERVVDAGVDSVEHGGDMTAELIAKIRDKGICIVPTLSAVFIQAREGLREGMRSDAVRRRQAQVADNSTWEGLKNAAAAGVTFCFGTDAGSPLVPHDRILDELLAWKEIGAASDNLFLLRAMTVNGARLIGDDKLGSVEAGNYADFVITECNPLEDIKNIRSIKYVVLNGKIVRKYS